MSELAANAIEHTASGAGGVFIVGVGRPRDGVAFVAVTDCGGAEEPAVRDADGLAEGGRGLALVAACSSRWGYRNATAGRTVWAEVTWPVPVRRHEGAREVPGDIWQDIPEEIAGPTGVA